MGKGVLAYLPASSCHEEVMNRNTRLVIQTISYRIEKMLNDNDQKTFYFYGGDDIVDVVMALQKAYRRRAVISRTPAGIVAHLSPDVEYERLSDDQEIERPSSRQLTLAIRVPGSGRAER